MAPYLSLSSFSSLCCISSAIRISSGALLTLKEVRCTEMLQVSSFAKSEKLPKLVRNRRTSPQRSLVLYRRLMLNSWLLTKPSASNFSKTKNGWRKMTFLSFRNVSERTFGTTNSTLWSLMRKEISQWRISWRHPCPCFMALKSRATERKLPNVSKSCTRRTMEWA